MGSDKKVKHPDLARMDRIRPDGSVKTLGIEEQWQLVADWHAFLEEDKASDYPVLDGLNEAWEEIAPQYQVNGRPIMSRGSTLRNTAASPLAALFYMVDMGFYPPPELLLALLDCWDTYSAGAGRMTLEEAFLGPPVPKSGNYAARSQKRFKRMAMRSNFFRFIRDGMTREQAAEAVSCAVGGTPEPESILRMFRGPEWRPKITPEK